MRRARRIAGFLLATFAASLLFYAIFIPGGLVLNGRLSEWTPRIEGAAVFIWAVFAWPVVMLVAPFPVMAFVRQAEHAGKAGALIYGAAGTATALIPALVWLIVQVAAGGRLDQAWLAVAGLLIAGAFGGLVYGLIAARRADETRTAAMTD